MDGAGSHASRRARRLFHFDPIPSGGEREPGPKKGKRLQTTPSGGDVRLLSVAIFPLHLVRIFPLPFQSYCETTHRRHVYDPISGGFYILSYK